MLPDHDAEFAGAQARGHRLDRDILTRPVDQKLDQHAQLRGLATADVHHSTRVGILRQDP